MTWLVQSPSAAVLHRDRLTVGSTDRCSSACIRCEHEWVFADVCLSLRYVGTYCVHMCVCMGVSVILYVFAWLCMYVGVCGCLQMLEVRGYMCIIVCMRVCVCVCVCMGVHMYEK